MDNITLVILTVVANVISQFICKWLNGKYKR